MPHSPALVPGRAVGAALLALTTFASPAAPAAFPAAEIRALWVDGFHAGIRSPQEVRDLVADAKRIHVNTLIVQVRRRGDALYVGGLEPAAEDPARDPSFDGLAAIVKAGHEAGLEVHAWINAMPIWSDETKPPADPNHVFNRHGVGKAGADCWLTSSRDGVQRFPVGHFLDPGHPAAREHLVSVYLDIVRRYAVDGIHFDYIRYPETEERLPRGSNVGYNAVSVARFQRASGRGDVPEPGDEQWIAWRREQVTQLVRRVSIEARAINPKIKVSAATIAWGQPPSSLTDYPNASPMQRIFQNWQVWLAEGLLDLSVPMNYARESDARVRGWFDGWIAWEKRYKAGRQLAVGIGGYLNPPESVLAQVERARGPAGKDAADGVSFFSYFQPQLPPQLSDPEQAPANAPAAPDRLDFLAQGAAGSGAAFTSSAPVPGMPWIERPSHGFLAGTALGADARPLDGATVQVRRTGWFRKTRRTTADANGWFGMTMLAPGRYQVRLELAGGRAAKESVTVEVRAGAVARAELRRSQ
jgi:uncharacterized lipoprotein YddW (UPF0748 family)